jgi:hypothetical protein
MDNPNIALIAPAIVNRTVLRRPNAELRTREHLTAGEVEKLIDAASSNRQGQRDALMVLLAFRGMGSEQPRSVISGGTADPAKAHVFPAGSFWVNPPGWSIISPPKRTRSSRSTASGRGASLT